jgi:hypothetical protein
MGYKIEKYRESHYNQWNGLINRSKNGTFLFHRDFMEYHSDRFRDFSLLLFEDEKAVAAFPAHVEKDEVFSHRGLTYGGLIYDEKIKLTEVIRMLQATLQHLQAEGINKLHLKLVPSIYHKCPAEELNYALFVANAKLVRRDSLSVIDLEQALRFTKTRKEAIRRGKKNNLIIKEEPNFEIFWNKILIPNLAGKHHAKPVHTVEEITLLHSRFHDNIRHFNVYHNDIIVAGTTVFITDTVAHPQYISGQKDKNELGSLDYLYDHLITNVFANKKYFDFGISNEEDGRKLNEGLVFWKETFGARTIVQDFYEVDTSNHILLDSVII